jgi:hypothetical protein
MKSYAPPADAPVCPIPLIVTLATSPEHFAYSLCGPKDLAHRFAQPSTLGDSDGLLAALIEALRVVTPERKAQLMRCHKTYRSLVQQTTNAVLPDFEMIPVMVRTGDPRLIEAGEYLGTVPLNRVPDGIPRQLAEQLRRFEINWQPLPAAAHELQCLRRWATAFCHPGFAFNRSEESRRTYRDSLPPPEDMEQDGTADHIDEFNELELAA